MRRNFRVVRVAIESMQYNTEHQWGSRNMAIAECDEVAAAANDRGLFFQVEEFVAARKRWERIYGVNSAHAAAVAAIRRGPIALSVP